MSSPRVTVRMYKGLLGDCFLLRLFAGEVDAARGRRADAHILIDCGIIQRAPRERDRIGRVARDIAETCGNHLDLVVVTHEHYDHLCGFGIARDLFLGEDMRIDRLWLAWTEKPGDTQAERLRRLAEDTRMAIDIGVERMAVRATETAEQEWDLQGDAMGLDGFIGPLGIGGEDRMSSREILEALKTKVRPAEDDYLEPGQVRQTPGPVGLRTFVLGPPRNEARLFQDMPSSKGARETYLAAREAEAHSAARNFASCDSARGLEAMPFSRRYQQLKDADVLDAGLPDPGEDASPEQIALWEVRCRYLVGEQDWRRIDTDWQSAVAELALKLDADTNNTSLVLAFELEPGGEVLLFAADAQVGNWLSWHDQEYPGGGADGARVTAEDLLGRTTLYKVGHHGSHNATVNARGLELMTHPGLVAMLPLVEEVARRRRWPMPADKLYQRLVQKTDGRVLRGDTPPPGEMVQAGRVREMGDTDTGLGPLWVEYDAR